ncbi:mCG145267, partial [Mus musculus]
TLNFYAWEPQEPQERNKYGKKNGKSFLKTGLTVKGRSTLMLTAPTCAAGPRLNKKEKGKWEAELQPSPLLPASLTFKPPRSLPCHGWTASSTVSQILPSSRCLPDYGYDDSCFKLLLP